MGERQRTQVQGTPHGKMGVIGAMRILTNGTTITSIEKYGCLTGATLFGSAQFNISVWPPQPFYTIAASASYNTNGTIVNGSYTSASLTPSTFQIQPVGITPLGAIVSPVIWITVFGFIKQPIRGTLEAVYSMPHPPLDVIGSIQWSAAGGVVSNVRQFGVCKNVRLIASPGTFAIDIWPAQRFYTVCGMVSSDGTNSSAMLYLNSPAPVSTGFQCVAAGLGPATGRNAQINNITVFGFRPKHQEAAFGLGKGRLGVMGMSRYAVLTASTIGPVTAYGSWSYVIPSGSGFQFNNFVYPPFMGNYPARQITTTVGSYTWYSLPSTDLTVAMFTAWNATSATNGQPGLINLITESYPSTSAPALRGCQVLMNTLFGVVQQ